MDKAVTDFIRCVLQATIHTFHTTISTEVHFGKISIDENQKMDISIAGIIGLVSPTLRGTVTLCFPEKVFLAIMSKMLGETFTEITEDLADGAAELLNIIFGTAKTELNLAGFGVEGAIPSVVWGPDLLTYKTKGILRYLVPVESDVGAFSLKFALDVVSKKA